MKTYQFSTYLTDLQRDLIVIAIRKAGYCASREHGTLRTDASRTAIALVWGNALVIQ